MSVIEKNKNQKLHNEWEKLLLIKELIFTLNQENITQSLNSLINIFDESYSLSFNIAITQMVYTVLAFRMRDSDLYLNFLKEVENFEERKKFKTNFFNVFKQYLIHFSSRKESIYLLNALVEHNLMDPKKVVSYNYRYFLHYQPKTEIEIQEVPSYTSLSYEELSKNNFELHKKLIHEGINHSEISKVIWNDNVEKLQEISSQTNFDYNQKIPKSLYERCDFINGDNVSLIDYAAFFGSVKCFKYLLINNAKVENTGKYAVAGGNEEIIHLCEQNHSSFDKAYETAIEFHRNDIFKYFYDNKLKEINNLEELGNLCISYHNSEIFSFLVKEGMEINNDIINEAAIIGNIFLVEYFLKEHSIPHDILVFSAGSRNIELVEYVLKQKGIDINAKDIYLFYLIFILNI